MKNLFTAVLLFTACTVFAQKSGSAARIAAITSLEEYKLNMQFKDKLEYALENIEISCNDPKTSDDPETWRNKGEICAAVAVDDQLSKKYKKVVIFLIRTAHNELFCYFFLNVQRHFFVIST